MERNPTIYTLILVGAAACGGEEPLEPIPDAWPVQKPLVAGRTYAASGVLDDGRMFIVGGSRSGASTGVVEVLDAEWKELMPLAVARARHGAVLVGGELFVVGGIGPNGPLDTVERYDPATGLSQTLAALPAARFGHATVVYDGRIIVIGGEVRGGPSRSVLSYDPETNAWTSLADLTAAGGPGTRAVVYKDRIWAIGGYVDSMEQCQSLQVDECGALSAVEIYDGEANDWMRGPKLNVRRTEHSVAVVDNRIVVAGGYDVTALTSVEIFTDLEDVDDEIWEKGAAMSAPLAGAASHSSGGRMFVLGGYGSRADLDEVRAYRP